MCVSSSSSSLGTAPLSADPAGVEPEAAASDLVLGVVLLCVRGTHHASMPTTSCGEEDAAALHAYHERVARVSLQMNT